MQEQINALQLTQQQQTRIILFLKGEITSILFQVIHASGFENYQ
jgi:hypothetical protein